jgi:hypothetical protein
MSEMAILHQLTSSFWSRLTFVPIKAAAAVDFIAKERLDNARDAG